MTLHAAGVARASVNVAFQGCRRYASIASLERVPFEVVPALRCLGRTIRSSTRSPVLPYVGLLCRTLCSERPAARGRAPRSRNLAGVGVRRAELKLLNARLAEARESRPPADGIASWQRLPPIRCEALPTCLQVHFGLSGRIGPDRLPDVTSLVFVLAREGRGGATRRGSDGQTPRQQVSRMSRGDQRR